MMSKHKYFEGQHDDEEVLMVFRKHPVVMRRGLIYSMLALLLGTLPSFINPVMSWFFGGLAAGFVLSIIVFFPSWLSWYYSLFIVSNERFIQLNRRGMFNQSVSDLGLSHVQTLNYQVAGFQETLLGFGTIVIQTYLGDLVIHDVHHPAKTVDKMSEILRKYGDSAVAYPGDSSAEDPPKNA